jgi:hypothetical protein
MGFAVGALKTTQLQRYQRNLTSIPYLCHTLLERVGVSAIERERENFVLDEPEIFRCSIATSKNFGEVQEKICRS